MLFKIALSIHISSILDIKKSIRKKQKITIPCRKLFQISKVLQRKKSNRKKNKVVENFYWSKHFIL